MAENIKEFKITAMISVPAVFEKSMKIMKTLREKRKSQQILEKGKKISQFLLKVEKI